MDAESYCISQRFRLNTRPFISESALIDDSSGREFSL